MKLLINDNRTGDSVVTQLRCNTTEWLEHGLGVQVPGWKPNGVARKVKKSQPTWVSSILIVTLAKLWP